MCVSAERFPLVAKKPKVEAAAYLYGAREALESEVRQLYLRYWYKRSFTCVTGTKAQILTPEELRRHVRQFLSASMVHGGHDRLCDLTSNTHTSSLYTSTLRPHTLEP